MAKAISLLSRRGMRAALYVICAVFTLTAAGGIYWFWPRTIDPTVRESCLVWSVEPTGRQHLTIPGRKLVGFLGKYENELFAYLMFDFVKSRKEISGRNIMLIVNNNGDSPAYRIVMDCPSNLLDCAEEVYQLHEAGVGNAPSWGFFTPATVARFQQETQVFAQAYSGPVSDAFTKLSPKRRALYLSRFLRFKSATDHRVLGENDSGLLPLTPQEAVKLAADIIAVADFYELPLSYFLGIGAMENNYLDVKGDLKHRIWKRHADPRDVIVRRGKRLVLVENPAMGVWQITRETLRFAHSLFLQDRRDYSKLPERLRPGRTLDVDKVSTDTLTTYAGLLLRYLLDYFHGDVSRAVGAYNGGPGNPNQAYETGVRVVADYARRILDRAALLHEASVEQLRSSR